MFLVEGPQAVREALGHQPERVIELFVTPAGYAKNSDLVALASQHSIDLEQVSDPVLEVMADTATPQGVIAVVAMAGTTLANILAAKPTLLVLLDRVADPGNAGTIIRVAAAAGADAVLVGPESVDVYNPKTVRSTTGSLFHIPVIAGVDWADVFPALAAAGVQVIAADMGGMALPEAARTGVLTRPTAWLFGNEAHGLGDDVVAQADLVVSVPHFGPVESMNLATAAAVCLYQSAFAQNERP